MDTVWLVGCVAGSYILGSVPFGVIWVKLFTGKDIRSVGSGRTGGTNAMRAAGFGVGLLTALSDVFKGTLAVLAASWLLPPSMRAWGMMLAGLASVVGHNYPVFLKFKGGAGGATCVGAALGISWLAVLIMPVGAAILYFIGYASVATIIAALSVTVLFAYLAYGARLLDPIFIWFGVGSIVLLAWALRPNWSRLVRGEERLVGLRAKRQAAQAAKTPESSDSLN
jgi:glycerol-3-phosphate acyltransferase PlsY